MFRLTLLCSSSCTCAKDSASLTTQEPGRQHKRDYESVSHGATQQPSSGHQPRASMRCILYMSTYLAWNFSPTYFLRTRMVRNTSV